MQEEYGTTQEDLNIWMTLQHTKKRVYKFGLVVSTNVCVCTRGLVAD